MPKQERSPDTRHPIAIEVDRLSKTYRVWETPLSRLRVSFLEACARAARRLLGPKSPLAERIAVAAQHGFREIQALRGVSLQIGRGEVVGLIGYNGSGKSTLLQIIAGTLSPTSGRVEVRGRVAALLELGSGMNPDFTGRENAYLYGSILGVSRQFLESRMHAIETFAEIGQFFDDPVRTYSTGMAARLAFAVLTQLNPDILIVDEALSVGDAYFQHKSINLIRQFQQAGKTMIVVSHDAATIKTMCTRAVILEHGNLIREGPAIAVCDYYNALVAKKQKDLEIRQVERAKGHTVTRSGDRRVVIGDVELMNASETPTRSFTVGENARIVCALEFRDAVEAPTVGLLIRDRLGNDVYGTNTHHQGVALGDFTAGQSAEVRFALPLRLAPGRYSLTVAAHSGHTHLAANYDWQDNAVVFSVLPGAEAPFTGTAFLPTTVDVSRDKVAPLRAYQWGHTLSFSADGDAVRYKLHGWAIAEDEFTWTEGPEAALRFDLPASPKRNRTLKLCAGAFCTSEIPAQRVRIALDEHELGQLQISETREYSLALPSTLIATQARHQLSFKLPDATSPAALGICDDSRLLGLQLFSLKIE
ncbi:hypothetical protein AXK12_02135 [Cephaloticoccus capnophilus]|uniref:ABC transporter domain-containing protein n=1 Tax=Cephaloticoccus capnophilus TaxID=1548208 RepID=A0A139SRM9_9BACT|nr:ABC transporter ATP-binding protein [Cephaloticoccus capnophilus]KXU37236.1 hypothetical protein AXK12_02135 [Cephaloticoccus capnophilus]